MEIVWLGLGFLVGMALWTPFLIDERFGARRARIEGSLGRFDS
jgi:hypothetical protein